ncbi:MAG: PadR family transcriptional regulator [Methanosarcina barkeri]|nr:PadR family transcriptional regulator [Methanosarcina sp. ERenArc_MAG2]
MQSKQGSSTIYSDSELQKESDIESVVRKNLEMIVLSILKTHPMCGQDIVKEIFRQYQVFISQSSVYTILYSLKEKNILEASTIKGDLRSKVYIPTEKGNEIMNAMLDEFVFSIEHLLAVLKDTINKKR